MVPLVAEVLPSPIWAILSPSQSLVQSLGFEVYGCKAKLRSSRIESCKNSLYSLLLFGFGMSVQMLVSPKQMHTAQNTLN